MLSRGEENRRAEGRGRGEKKGGVKPSGTAGRKTGEQMKRRRADHR